MCRTEWAPAQGVAQKAVEWFAYIRLCPPAFTQRLFEVFTCFFRLWNLLKSVHVNKERLRRRPVCCPITALHVSSCRVASNLSAPVASRRILSRPIFLAQSRPIPSRPVVSCSVMPNLVLFFCVLFCAVLSRQVQPRRVVSCPVLVDTAGGTDTATVSRQVSSHELNEIRIRIDHLSAATN